VGSGQDQSDIDYNADATRPTTGRLHPRVYAILIGLTAWFALAVWGFAGVGFADYLLVIVSGFIFVVVALTLILARVGRMRGAARGDEANKDGKPLSLLEWAAGDFETWQGRQSGMHAAILILLPIAVAAIGMTAFAIAFYIVEKGV
jgi:hypothetical protein